MPLIRPPRATSSASSRSLATGSIKSQAQCESTRFVFDFFKQDEGALARIGADDVFSCKKLVARALTESEDSRLDYAIVQLDRPATPVHAPARVAKAAGKLHPGDPLTLIGYPNGIPAKIDDGGAVLNPRDRDRD